MKLDPRRVPAFLRAPGNTRCVLLHGDDAGLIRERAAQLVLAVAGQADDPFRVAVLDRDGHDRLEEEAGALSLLGGQRVVRLRDAGDGLVASLKRVLAGPGDTLVVLEAAGLTSRSKLRALLDGAPNAAVIACYPDEGQSLADTIRAGLRLHNVAVEADALDFLVGQLGADRALTAGEVAKLALFVGDGGHVGLGDAQACVGEAAALSVDDALHAMAEGDPPAADRAMALALQEGAAPVGLLRAAQMHIHRLHRARLLMDAGQSAGEAAKSLRPPVFFRRMPSFTRALSLWPSRSLLHAMETLAAAELACKRSGAPDVALCRDAIAALARRAHLVAGRR